MVKDSFTDANKSYWSSFKDIEEHAMAFWEKDQTNETPLSDTNDKRKYILGMFPYPSGNAHMGHARVYTLTDIQARMARFKGNSVLHPLGWDSFGLPAENAAIQNNVHPDAWTNANIKSMRDEQLANAGFSFDFNKELATSSPEYYKWSQWLFLKMYEAGLAERRQEWVNWDPVDKTVLANEQVIDGKGWRSGAAIEQRKMEQWSIRITDYAEELWNGLSDLNEWPSKALAAQKHWIGRSEGVELSFSLENEADEKIDVFTTRPDTVYGVTALVIAPESDLLQKLTIPENKKSEIDVYIKASSKLSDLDRQTTKTDKTGVNTGLNVVHPLTGESIPLFVANYVIASHGTGAVMVVPAHDQRDFDFAKKFEIPILPVISENGQEELDMQAPYTGNGVLINSRQFDGMDNVEAQEKITNELRSNGSGSKKVNYRLKDWSISRQRFWGAPIPMVKDALGNSRPVPAEELPVKLPTDVDFSSTDGKSPLEASPEFYEYEDPETGEILIRETDTLDTFMCSSWYIWRFLDPSNTEQAWDKEDANKWMPVDVYVGGIEHANQHLIYLRFMSHFLYEQGLTPTKEPITRFQANGMVKLDGSKMSKSKGNVVRPDDVIEQYGADALRIYILADTPYDRDIDWDENGLKAKQSFVSKVYAFYQENANKLPNGAIKLPKQVEDEWSVSLLKTLFDAVDKMDVQISENSDFHLAVSQLYNIYNLIKDRASQAFSTEERTTVFAYATQSYLKMAGIIMPHTAEFLWQNSFDMEESLFRQPWPDTSYALDFSMKNDVQIPVMVNGKKRGVLNVCANDNDKTIIDAALGASDERITQHFLDATQLKKSIVVRGKEEEPKLINLVFAQD